MTDLDSLIEELEKAEEGSLRELDYVIAFGPPGRHLSDREGAPHYTTSLDAALTLVPSINAPQTPAKSWPATVDIRRHDDGSGTATIAASDMTPEDADDEMYVEAHAATPALALCIAALRAWLATESNPQHDSEGS